MADVPTRLRINLAQGEFEVEGSEAFVKAYAERFETLLERLNGAAGGPPPGLLQGVPVDGPVAPPSFGEIIQALPRAVTDVDRMLVAGHFAQLRNSDKSFSTGEASRLLTEQGIKVGNPSQCVRQNLVAKRVFKHQGRYRVSQPGVDHLRQLLGPAFPEAA